MTVQSWDSSQICVTHNPVVTRKPYCPQRVRGQPAEDGGGREGCGGCGWPRWLAGAPSSRHTCGRHPGTACYFPGASPTEGLDPLLQPGPKAPHGSPTGLCALPGTPHTL